MRIKITKTIDANEIPPEARKMIDRIKNRIIYELPDLISKSVRSSLATDAEEFFSTVSHIEDIRGALKSIDENLAESSEIILGYKKILMPEPKTQDEETPEWLEKEQAEYEKLMSQVDGAGEVEDEEG